MKDGLTLGNWSYLDVAEWQDKHYDTQYPLNDEDNENVTLSSVGSNIHNDDNWNRKLSKGKCERSQGTIPIQQVKTYVLYTYLCTYVRT